MSSENSISHRVLTGKALKKDRRAKANWIRARDEPSSVCGQLRMKWPEERDGSGDPFTGKWVKRWFVYDGNYRAVASERKGVLYMSKSKRNTLLASFQLDARCWFVHRDLGNAADLYMVNVAGEDQEIMRLYFDVLAPKKKKSWLTHLQEVCPQSGPAKEKKKKAIGGKPEGSSEDEDSSTTTDGDSDDSDASEIDSDDSTSSSSSSSSSTTGFEPLTAGGVPSSDSFPDLFLEKSALRDTQESSALQILLDSAVTGDDARGFLTTSDSDGWTALHFSAWKGWTSCLGWLLSRSGCFADQRSSDGWTPLLLAAQRGHAEAVQLLILFGADETAWSAAGKSASTLAKKFPRVLRVLDRVALVRKNKSNVAPAVAVQTGDSNEGSEDDAFLGDDAV